MSNFLDFCQQLPELYFKISEIAELELRKKERPSHTWNPSDLAQETLLKLFQAEAVPENLECDRVFSSYVTTVMDRLLINYGERKRRVKRGGDMTRQHVETLDDLEFRREEFDEELYFEVHGLLEKLATEDPREAEIFKMRWYAGYQVSQIAQWYGLSKRSIQRELQSAASWLKKEVKKLDR